MNTATQTTTVSSRKSAMFSYEDNNGDIAYMTHAELLALRNKYVKAFPDQRHEIFEDESIFNPKVESAARQEMVDWAND